MTPNLSRVILSLPSLVSLATTADTADEPRSWIQLAKTGTFHSTRYGKFSITRDDAQFRQEFNRDWSSRALFLTFSYSFGTPDRTRRPQQQQQQGPDPMDME